MSGSIKEMEQSIAISDPGEKDRDRQGWADRVVIQVGNVTAWLFPTLMLAICTQVVIREMGFNQAWLDDAQWWICGFAMTVGFAHVITTQSHAGIFLAGHPNVSGCPPISFNGQLASALVMAALGFFLGHVASLIMAKMGTLRVPPKAEEAGAGSATGSLSRICACKNRRRAFRRSQCLML